jgi:hypothetical protein
LLPPELLLEPPFELPLELLEELALVAAGVLEGELSELLDALDPSPPLPLSLLAEALSEPPSDEFDPERPEPFLPP